jgi:lipopolysaccharide biosynthesis glycosyltransferase
MANLNVYYSIDNNEKNYKMCMLSIISLIENNKNNNINIYLLDAKISKYNVESCSKEKKQNLESYIKRFNGKVILHWLNATALMKKYLLEGPNETWKHPRYKKISLLYARYLIAFFKVPKKILWLDCDTIIQHDLSKLWDIDMSDYQWAGREDIFDASNGKYTPFLQNGVMLLNMPKISSIFKKIIFEYKTKNYGEIGDMVILNKLADKKLSLPKKFNSYRITKKAYILHFCLVFIIPCKTNLLFSFKNNWKRDIWFYYIKHNADFVKIKGFSYDEKITSAFDLKCLKTDDELNSLNNFPFLSYIYVIYNKYF